jgi:hypothetical protein
MAGIVGETRIGDHRARRRRRRRGVVDGVLREGADEIRAAAVLRMLGVNVEEAARVAALAMG